MKGSIKQKIMTKRKKSILRKMTKRMKQYMKLMDNYIVLEKKMSKGER